MLIMEILLMMVDLEKGLALRETCRVKAGRRCCRSSVENKRNCRPEKIVHSFP